MLSRRCPPEETVDTWLSDVLSRRCPREETVGTWLSDVLNRKEGNDQESIQLSNTSIRDIKGKETQTRNNWTLMETSLAETQTDSYFPTKWPNGYPKQKM